MCFLSKCGVAAKQIKNYEPLVSSPALAIDNTPLWVCGYHIYSSANFSPYILLPPEPFCAVISPPCAIKPYITLWKKLSLKLRLSSFLPFAIAKKLLAVFGTYFVNNSNTTVPSHTITPELPISISKKTWAFSASNTGSSLKTLEAFTASFSLYRPSNNAFYIRDYLPISYSFLSAFSFSNSYLSFLS